jgi:uncharacterized low-complexity protein
MNHTTTTKNLALVGVLAAITAALTGTIAISIIQNAAAAQNDNATDIENSGTNSKFKQKEKNNCSGFADCTNRAIEMLGSRTPTP